MISINCQPEPEFTIDGIDYYTRKKCLRSVSETTYEYHYGYSYLAGKYQYHYGPITQTVCIEYKIDTIQIKD